MQVGGRLQSGWADGVSLHYAARPTETRNIHSFRASVYGGLPR